MNISSNLKNYLIDLRKQNIIDEKLFVHLIDEFKVSSKNTQQQSEVFLPLVDMFGLIYNEAELERLDESILTIETKMKDIIQAWENKAISRDEAKIILTKLVFNKQKMNNNREKFLYRMKIKISRLKKLESNNQINLKELLSLLLKNAETEDLSNLIITFRAIWKKYSVDAMSDESRELKSRQLMDVESEILESLLIPLPEEEKVIFNLDEIIQPIEKRTLNKFFSNSTKEDNNIQPLKKKNSLDINQDNFKISSTHFEYSSWNLVGKISYNLNSEPVGIFRPPIIINGTGYLPIVMEKPLSISILKNKYRDVLKERGLDLRTTTTQEVRKRIATALNIPEKLALHPSFFNQWLLIVEAEVSPIKPQITKVHLIEPRKIRNLQSNTPTIDEADLRQIEIPAWIPAPGNSIITKIPIGETIIGMAGSNFGSIAGLMSKTPFGQSFTIKREIPPTYLLTILLESLGKRNFTELRFSIAKKLNIGEGEAFSANSIWEINNQERLLISPHEIAVSYYSILPTAAFTFNKKIYAKLGVYFHSIPETFRYLIGKPIYKTNEIKGLIYGFSVKRGEMFVLWTPKNPVNLIKEVGRKSSNQYVSRFKRRMALALGVSYQESLLPSNMARYFLNFIWMTEKQSLMEAMTVIEEKFTLKNTAFMEIEEITKDGLKCQTVHG